MSSKKNPCVFAGAILVLCACVLLGVLLLLQSIDGNTKASYDKINTGMTVQEVELIFGTPGDEVNSHITAEEPQKTKGRHVLMWITRDFDAAIIEFLDNGVVQKDWHYSSRTFLQRLWHRVGFAG